MNLGIAAMPLFTIVRFLLSLVSIALWAGVGYLLWTWYRGEWITQDYGQVVRDRESWRLLGAIAMVALDSLAAFPCLD